MLMRAKYVYCVIATYILAVFCFLNADIDRSSRHFGGFISDTRRNNQAYCVDVLRASDAQLYYEKIFEEPAVIRAGKNIPATLYNRFMNWWQDRENKLNVLRSNGSVFRVTATCSEYADGAVSRTGDVLSGPEQEQRKISCEHTIALQDREGRRSAYGFFAVIDGYFGRFASTWLHDKLQKNLKGVIEKAIAMVPFFSTEEWAMRAALSGRSVEDEQRQLFLSACFDNVQQAVSAYLTDLDREFRATYRNDFSSASIAFVLVVGDKVEAASRLFHPELLRVSHESENFKFFVPGVAESVTVRKPFSIEGEDSIHWVIFSGAYQKYEDLPPESSPELSPDWRSLFKSHAKLTITRTPEPLAQDNVAVASRQTAQPDRSLSHFGAFIAPAGQQDNKQDLAGQWFGAAQAKERYDMAIPPLTSSTGGITHALSSVPGVLHGAYAWVARKFTRDPLELLRQYTMNWTPACSEYVQTSHEAEARGDSTGKKESCEHTIALTERAMGASAWGFFAVIDSYYGRLASTLVHDTLQRDIPVIMKNSIQVTLSQVENLADIELSSKCLRVAENAINVYLMNIDRYLQQAGDISGAGLTYMLIVGDQIIARGVGNGGVMVPHITEDLMRGLHGSPGGVKRFGAPVNASQLYEVSDFITRNQLVSVDMLGALRLRQLVFTSRKPTIIDLYNYALPAVSIGQTGAPPRMSDFSFLLVSGGLAGYEMTAGIGPEELVRRYLPDDQQWRNDYESIAAIRVTLVAS